MKGNDQLKICIGDVVNRYMFFSLPCSHPAATSNIHDTSSSGKFNKFHTRTGFTNTTDENINNLHI